MEKETISGDEFRKILGQYAKIPDANYSKWDRETVRPARALLAIQLLNGQSIVCTFETKHEPSRIGKQPEIALHIGSDVTSGALC